MLKLLQKKCYDSPHYHLQKKSYDVRDWRQDNSRVAVGTENGDVDETTLTWSSE